MLTNAFLEQGRTIRLRLPVRDSPILPNGIPKQCDQQDQRLVIRPTTTYVPSSQASNDGARGQGEWIQAKLLFRRYWRNSPNHNPLESTGSTPARIDWHPRVLQFAGGAPVCLVGYLNPRRLQANSNVQSSPLPGVSKNSNTRLISLEEGEDAARQIGAEAYLEWTEETSRSLELMKTLFWYGYYYHLDKPFSPAETRKDYRSYI
ncbi:1537_t:CDS:2 [Acaulospora colombiana]|uniref:1537_t:CDS:1 n=1 Tax=Acaulospora colombiana TaxID=27376 RepID=A0ACA9L3I7_9GLOM|nr:1537_t:CDS:2 [Acaulospora colombiana]